jgi:DNA transposition AAA+ family ATPase
MEYSASATKWTSHTSSPEFAAEFKATAAKFADDNDARAAAIEAFLLVEASKAGVVKVIPHRPNKNPNKWAKHLAPWFNENCRNARDAYRTEVSTRGKHHSSATSAL